MAGYPLLAVDALAVALLLNAAAVKAAAPGPLRRALTELAPAAPVTDTTVRMFAAAETIAALALVLAPVRTASAVAVTVLGLCFAAFGVAGRVRGTALPCGCFGRRTSAPLGATNVVLGLALALVLPAHAALPARDGDTASTAATAVGAALATLALCLWMNRDLVRDLFWDVRTAAARSGAR
jgi:hypothetical protein